MKFTIPYTIAFLIVALSIIPQNSVAPGQDVQDIMEILESVKFIDDYTNSYNSVKDGENRDKWKVYQLSIKQLREKIMAAHPEYEEDDHTLADAVELRKGKSPPGMHEQCKWVAALKGLANAFGDRLGKKKQMFCRTNKMKFVNISKALTKSSMNGLLIALKLKEFDRRRTKYKNGDDKTMQNNFVSPDFKNILVLLALIIFGHLIF